MKSFYFLVIFILFSLASDASWDTYENNLRNTGTSNATGYFPLKTANFTNDYFGMNFQPLVDDIDNDGNNEILIFSNNSLIVFNPQLEVKSQTKVGNIMGQPTLFNFDNDSLMEIMFNARQNSSFYFFAYQLNNSVLKQEFNVSLPYDANFSGIKCLKLGSSGICVFKDKLNYVHVIDLSAKTDSSYSTSNFNETKQTVPAIGDIDNDGNLDAVFWYNNDSNQGYGFLAFDLGQRKIKWAVDNIFSPNFFSYTLKGQPVLVDLNNDNKLEIAASAFYDDNLPNLDPYNDWFTELFVYNSSGSKLFSKCEKNTVLDNGCNDGSSTINRWEGSNPFILDYDKNGIDDVCFIKDVKISGSFSYMALNCYNYSGSEIAKVKLTSDQGIESTAMAADMNNDGLKDIITAYPIFLQNGTSIGFNPSLGTYHPIAVDIDGNNGLDLIWTKGNQTKVFLDSNNYTRDLSVSVSDIIFSKFDKTHVNVSAIIKNTGQIEADNVKAAIYNTETLENKTFVFNIRKNSNATISAVLGLKENQKVLVSADYENEINETNEEDNFAFKEFMELPYVYVSADLEPQNVESEFKDYIKNKLTSGYYTANENEADVKVYIGKNNPRNKDKNINLMNNYNMGYDYGNIIYNDKIGANPYSALVAGFKNDALFGEGTVTVMIAGNDIEGDIAGAKEFIKNQALFLGTKDKESVFVDDENADAVRVYDYLHNDVNQGNYKQATDNFKLLVRSALNDSMFNEKEYNVTTSNNVILKIRNLKSNLSNDYLLYLNSTNDVFMPVVMSGGIWADITSWQDLGGELASSGRDIWLVEITGGTNTECDGCINYNYTDLVDDFWPALIAAVEKQTGKDKIQYVAHSNGCRVALDSLSNWSSTGKASAGKIIYNGNEIAIDMLSNPVDTFVGVACPGNFSELSYFAKQINNSGAIAIQRLKDNNNLHPKFGDVAHELESASGEVAGLSRFLENPRISLNLFNQYYDWIRREDDKQPGKNLNFNYFTLIYGTLGFASIGKDDTIVSVKDEIGLFNDTTPNNKKILNVTTIHVGMTKNQKVKNMVKESLDKTIYKNG